MAKTRFFLVGVGWKVQDVQLDLKSFPEVFLNVIIIFADLL